MTTHHSRVEVPEAVLLHAQEFVLHKDLIADANAYKIILVKLVECNFKLRVDWL